MIEVWWYMGIDKLVGEVTRPFPWIDSEGLGKLADLTSNRLKDMEVSATNLQQDGWALKIDRYAVVATTDKYSKLADVYSALSRCGIDHKGCTIIIK